MPPRVARKAPSDRITVLERAVFGYPTDNGAYVDGMLQALTDMRDGQRRMLAVGVRIGLPLLAIGALSVFGNLLHNYNLSETIGHLLKGFVGG